MTVVGVAVNWLGAHVLHRNGREWYDMHSSITSGRSRRGRHAFGRNQVRIDGLQTKQLPETIRDVYRGFAHGVAPAARRLHGRADLNMIQAIPPANGRRGRVVEEFVGRPDLISRRYYGNTEGNRIHGGCLGFL